MQNAATGRRKGVTKSTRVQRMPRRIQEKNQSRMMSHYQMTAKLTAATKSVAAAAVLKAAGTKLECL